MMALMSFSLRFKDKITCYVLVLIGFAVVAFTANLAFAALQKQQSDPNSDSSWSIFLAAACLLAWVLGVALGDLNYFYNMEPYYDTSNLNTYPAVHPAQMPGQQVMDAGLMTFVSGSQLDLKKAMAFHNEDTYCVAPIVNGAMSCYDFWAVGTNCCKSAPGDNSHIGTSINPLVYSCGEYNNPLAMSGLRVMREDHREFFRLAVKQAESAYSIRANHALFFHWMQDPGSEMAAYMDDGSKYFLLGVFGFFAFLLFAILVAVVLFSRS